MGDAISCPSCKRAFAFKPELAGKSVKCKCGHRFTFPAKVAAKKTKSLCPNCEVPMAPEAILCTQCGFNRKTGKSIQAAVTGPRLFNPSPGDAESTGNPMKWIWIGGIAAVVAVALSVGVWFSMQGKSSTTEPPSPRAADQPSENADAADPVATAPQPTATTEVAAAPADPITPDWVAETAAASTIGWPALTQSWIVPPIKPAALLPGQPPLALQQNGLVRTFGGFEFGVTDVVFSPDGKQIAAGGADATIHVWDIATGREICVCKGHDPGVINRVVFSGDGKQVFSGSDDQTVRRWDVATGKQTMLYKGHTHNIAGLAFDPKNSALLSSSYDGKCILWDTATGKPKHTFNLNAVAESCTFSADGKSCFVGTVEPGPGGVEAKNGLVRQFDLTTWNEIQTFKGHPFAICDVRVSQDGTQLITSCDKQCIVYDIATAAETHHFPMSPGTCNFDARVAFSKDLSSMYPAGGVGLNVIHGNQGKSGLTFSNKLEIHSLAVSPDDRYLAMAYGGAWADAGPAKIVAGQIVCVYLFDRKEYERSVGADSTSKPNVARLTALDAGRFAFTGAKIDIVDTQTKKIINSFPGIDRSKFWQGSPDGQVLAAVTPDNKIHLYQTDTGKAQLLEAHHALVNSLAFTHDHATLYSADNTGMIISWKTQTGAQDLTLNLNKPVQEIALANNDSELLAVADGNLIRLKPADPKSLRAVPLHIDFNKGTWSLSGICPSGREDLALLKFSLPQPVKGAPGTSLVAFYDLGRNALISGIYGPFNDSFASGVHGLDDGRVLVGNRVYGVNSASDHGMGTLDEVSGIVIPSASADLAYALGSSGDLISEPLQYASATSFEALSNDRKYFFSGFVGSVQIWNTATGKVAQRLFPPDMPNTNWSVLSVVASPDSTRVATVERPYPNGPKISVRLWDLESGTQIKALDNITDGSSAAFSPDGKTLAVTSTELRAKTRLFDLESGSETASIPEPGPNCRAAFSPDGRYLLLDNIFATQQGSEIVWDLQEKKQCLAIPEPFESKEPATLCKDGTVLISNQGAVRLVSYAKGNLWSVPRKDMPAVRGIVSPDGHWALFLCEDHSVRLLDMKNGKEAHKWGTSAATSQGVAYNGQSTWWGESTPATESIAFTPDNQAMMLLDNQSLLVYNPVTAKETSHLEIRILFKARPLLLPDNSFAIMNTDLDHPYILPLAAPN